MPVAAFFFAAAFLAGLVTTAASVSALSGLAFAALTFSALAGFAAFLGAALRAGGGVGASDEGRALAGLPARLPR